MRVAVLFAILPLAAACSTAAQHAPQSPTNYPADAAPAARGLAFAQANCAACHSVDGGTSPKPEAPTFAAVVNKPGLTADTLRPWLQNSHNFPEIMNFAIAPEQIDDLAAHMLTLKDPAYRPPIR